MNFAGISGDFTDVSLHVSLRFRQFRGILGSVTGSQVNFTGISEVLETIQCISGHFKAFRAFQGFSEGFRGLLRFFTGSQVVPECSEEFSVLHKLLGEFHGSFRDVLILLNRF